MQQIVKKDSSVLEGFIVQKLEICNWGSFSGIHALEVPFNGLLITGFSGTGKSIFLDAYSSLLIRPKWKSYNAASDDRITRNTTRNDVDYIRGNWGKTENKQGLPSIKYLREGSTFTLLMVTFKNHLNQIISLIQIFYLNGNSTDLSQIKRHFMIVEDDFSLEQLSAFNFNFRDLKKKFTEPDFIHFENFGQYEASFMSKLGIENPQALRLLHIAQSIKSINSVNEFIGNKMLEDSKTKHLANELLKGYQPLEIAYEKVLDLIDQAELLNKIREKYLVYLKLSEKCIESDVTGQYFDQYKLHVHLNFYEEENKLLEVAIEFLKEKINSAQLEIDDLENEKNRLIFVKMEKGGFVQSEIKRDIKHVETELLTKQLNKNSIKKYFKIINLDIPTNENIFSELINVTQEILKNNKLNLIKLTNKYNQFKNQFNEVNINLEELKSNVNILKNQNARIVGNKAIIRRRLAKELDIQLEDLPFVAELIEINESGIKHSGVLERLLHDFGSSILVNSQEYYRVNNYINNHHLNGEIHFYNVDVKLEYNSSKKPSNKVLNCLNIKKGLFKNWITDRLTNRYNFDIVDSLERFHNSDDSMITFAGLYKRNNGKHTKSDLWKIDDSTNWILGFDNKYLINELLKKIEKENAFKKLIEKKIRKTEELIDISENESYASRHIMEINWASIDTESLSGKLIKLNKKLIKFKKKNIKLMEIEDLISEIDKNISSKNRLSNENKDSLAVKRNKLEINNDEAEKIRPKLLEIQPKLLEKIETLFDYISKQKSINLINQKYDRIVKVYNNDDKKNNASLIDLKNRIKTELNNFNISWEALSLNLNLNPEIESVIEYLSYLKKIEHDGIIKFKKEFRDLMNQQAVTHLTDLFNEFKEAQLLIAERINVVNDALKSTQYNNNTFLQIYPIKIKVEPVSEFVKLIRNILSYSTGTKFEEVEERWKNIKILCDKLKCLSAEDKSWTKKVLDIRFHYEYIAKEHVNNDLMTVANIYDEDTKYSGGEKEKLASAILASAIKYQMSGENNNSLAYRTIVLDEAFTKMDPKFTLLAMNIFKALGFHMMIATPMSSSMVISTLVGGAVIVSNDDNHLSSYVSVNPKYDDEFNFNYVATE